MDSVKSKTFIDLVVWQKAHNFVLNVYKSTEIFPKSELFGLVSQFRRAAVSIAANIAEGYRKTGKADKLRFMNIAQGSLEECRYYIILSKDLNYINEQTNIELIKLIEEVSRLLNGYCKGIMEKFNSIINNKPQNPNNNSLTPNNSH
jgi:four helix bundle protein